MDESILQLLPFAILSLLFLFLAYPICRRKGKAPYAFLCIIPFIGWFVLIYFASLPDKQILDRLAALEGRMR